MSVCKDIFIVQIQLSNYVTFIVLLKWTVRLQVQIWKQMFVAKHFFFFCLTIISVVVFTYVWSHYLWGHYQNICS